MKSAILSLLFISSVQAQDLACINTNIRHSMTEVINFHRQNLDLDPVSQEELFLRKSIDNNGVISENYPLFTTVGELQSHLIEHSSIKEIDRALDQSNSNISAAFLINWTLKKNFGPTTNSLQHKDCD